jgi:hypothetical protein
MGVTSEQVLRQHNLDAPAGWSPRVAVKSDVVFRTGGDGTAWVHVLEGEAGFSCIEGTDPVPVPAGRYSFCPVGQGVSLPAAFDGSSFDRWAEPSLPRLSSPVGEAGAGVEPVPGGILDLSAASEPWARSWAVLATAREFEGGYRAGFYEEPERRGGANPNPGRRGILYIHPVSEVTPARLAARVKVPAGGASLDIAVSGNRDRDGDWSLAVRVDGQLQKVERIKGGSGWRDVRVDLAAFAGREVEVEIQARANNWSFEFAFFDEIRVTAAP